MTNIVRPILPIPRRPQIVAKHLLPFFILHDLNIQFSVILMVLQTTSINYFSSSFRHYYLCDYLPLSAGKDLISRSLLKFKHRTQPDFSTWIQCALEALHEIPLTPDTIILRALHHDEITVSVFPTALDFLGHALAGRFGCRYLPSFLRKSRTARPCKELSHRQRKTELRGIYSLDPAARQMITAPTPSLIAPASPAAVLPPAGPSTPPTSGAKAVSNAVPAPPFLLIDDILTTGTTMRMIIKPLRHNFPLSPIRIFTLARANDTPSPPNPPSTPPPQDTSSGQ
jgi:predicted amidophosphoribosyltransferase